MMTDGGPSRLVELDVRGMHCGACVAHVEKALRSVDGVVSANVSLATERAVAEVSGTDDRSPELIGAMRNAGFEGSVRTSTTERLQRRREERAVMRRAQRRELIFAFVFGLPVVALHVWHVVVGSALEVSPVLVGGLTLLTLVLGARSMLRGAARSLRAGHAGMDLLVSLGAVVAMVSSMVGVATGRPDLIFFDATVMIVMFVGVGRFLETRARAKTSDALESLFLRVPAEALKVTGDTVGTVAADTLRVGDVVQVDESSTVPIDGTVQSGTLEIDESIVTGEALPVARSVGDRVLGGTRVIVGSGRIVVSATGDESTIGRIAQLVEDAQSNKTDAQRMADRAAGVFVPIIIILAVVTLVGWLVVRSGDVPWALERAVAVLVVACPCALGLAIPIAVVVGSSRAARSGILVREPAALERLAVADTVFLDKTGTLTSGEPHVVAVETVASFDRDSLTRLAATLAQASEHPLSRALVQHASADLPDPPNAQRLPGRGLRGKIDGRDVILGNVRFLQSAKVDVPEDDGDERTSIYVGIDGTFAGVFRFEDTVHPESHAAVNELKALGVMLSVVSGDRSGPVDRLASSLDIAVAHSEVQPNEKSSLVEDRRDSGHVVVMVGDGVNDAPALAAADVGIAIGTGADVARNTAHLCLIGHSPMLVPRSIVLARRISRVMKQNLVWAVAYNVVMLPVAMMSSIPPWAATGAMMVSSLSVVANALRLRRA